MGVELNNAHFDISFVWIDQIIMKICPIEETYPESENCTKSYWPESFNHGVDPLGISKMFPLIFTSVRWAVKDWAEQKQIQFSQNTNLRFFNVTVI